MKLSSFHSALRAQPTAALEFVFDDGDTIPASFHITEVGHVTRRFIDCGGTKRTSENILLQAWVSPRDPDHRLAAGKLASILDRSADLLPGQDLDVEIEYEDCVISQYGVAGVEQGDGVVRFRLADKHTDCLAKDACGVAEASCGSAGARTVGCC